MMSFKNCIRIRIATFGRPAYYFWRLRRCHVSVNRSSALGGFDCTQLLYQYSVQYPVVNICVIIWYLKVWRTIVLQSKKEEENYYCLHRIIIVKWVHLSLINAPWWVHFRLINSSVNTRCVFNTWRKSSCTKLHCFIVFD